MVNLLRKDFLVTRWVHIMAAIYGLVLIPIALYSPQSVPLAMAFFQIIYTHLVFNSNQRAGVSRADNLLLNSLPVTRNQIVDRQYLYAMLCALLFPAYLCAVAAALTVFGVPLVMPTFVLHLMLSTMGVLYHLLLTPIAFINSRYAGYVSMFTYLGIFVLPQRIGKGIGEEQMAGFFARIVQALGSWGMAALLLVGLMGLGMLSLTVGRRAYRRAEF